MAIIRTQRVLDIATLVWDDTAMSTTAKRVTDALDLLDVSEHAQQRPINEVAYTLNWTNDGTVVGTFAIEVTNTPSDGDSWVSATSLGISDEAGPNTLELATGFAFCRLVYTNISGTGTLGVTTVAGKRSAGQVAAATPVGRSLHNTDLGPLALWQLQGEEVAPGDPLTIDLSDTAGAVGGPYDLSIADGTIRVGAGHAPQFQSWANQSDRLESIDTDLNLIAAMSVAMLVNPASMDDGFLIGWTGAGELEADNATHQLSIIDRGFSYLHENAGGVNNIFATIAMGVLPGAWQHLCFTRAANGVDLKFFINGVKVAETTAANAPTGGGSQLLSLGEHPGTTPNYEAAFESVIYFDKEITEAEVLGLAQLTLGTT